MATTAAESRFRIDAPIAPSKATRIVALDDAALAVVSLVARGQWNAARFYACSTTRGDQASRPESLELVTLQGTAVSLASELDGVDALVLVVTSDQGTRSAAVIGSACSARGIMTAGLVLANGTDVPTALAALRPHVRVLMVPADLEDLTEFLRAIRA